MRSKWLTAALLAALLLPGCGKQKTDEDQLDDETRQERYYVNMFGFNVMSTYYLWTDEIASALKEWRTDADPVEKVREIRYKDASGKDIDRWTMLTDDFESFTGSIAGVYKTTGLDFQLFYGDSAGKTVVGVVTFVYRDSPASKAGLKRGDVFTKVNGTGMTPDNYSALVENLFGTDPFKLDFLDGRSLTLTPVMMTEDAVNVVDVVDLGDRKVGYLHYTSFTLVSIPGLMKAFGDFKEAGIDDLVLDLRYNGGGYVSTCTVLASMIAPLETVEAGSVFSREVYNSVLTEAWKDEESSSCFQTDFGSIDLGDGTVVTCPAGNFNSDLPRLYVLVGTGTASASESLICGLKPYMDVTVIGRQTHGKYCAGLMIGAPKWYGSVKDELEEGVYDKALPYVDNWGIYVMYARYADCNGVTLSMPDGIVPDVEVDDKPQDGFDLGDPEETMFAAALSLIRGDDAGLRAPTRSASAPVPVPEALHRPGFGVFVGNRF